MKRSILIASILSGLLLLNACGGGSAPPAISVSVTPSAQTNIDQGQTLSFTATVTNDSSSKGVTWALSGTGCSGAACGTLTNSTTSAATYNAPATVAANTTVTVQATSVADTTKSQSATVVVTPTPSVTTTSLAGGTMGTAYSATLQASGGAGTLTWSLASGSSLPAGLSLSSAGAITGTPTASGTTNFTVKVTDASGGKEGVCSQTKQLSITIAPPPISVSLTPATQTNIDQGQTLNFTATVNNDSANKGVTWSVSGSTCTGTACGTFTNSTTAAATYNAPTPVSANMTVMVQGTSIADTSKSTSTAVVVSPAASITTTSLANGTVGAAYNATLQATGGAGTLTWSLASGSSLPAGLSLSSAGVISGGPTAAGTTSFTVKVTDASAAHEGPVSVTKQLSITIAAAPLTITTTSLPNATVNTAYSQPLQASGGTPPYTWTVASGSTLPAGLSLGGSGTSWTLSGTPTQTGTFNFSLTVTDSATPTPQSKTQALSLTVSPASTACGTGNESALSGQYAFSLSGYNSSGFMAVIGSFTADGSGHITAGTVDSNGVSLGVENGSITASGSSYSVGADNRGCATIVTPFYTFKTRFALNTVSGASAGGTMQEWESASSPLIASGLILKQAVPASLPTGVWVYEQWGVFSTSQTRTGVAGTLTVNNITDPKPISAGEYDSNAGGSHVTRSGLSGSYTAPVAPTGRFTTTTSVSSVTAHRAAYLVSGTRFLEITTDALGATTSALVGDARLQSSSLTLSGNLAFYTSGIVSGATGGIVDFGPATVSGSTLSVKIFEDEAGTWTTPTPTIGSCTFAIDSYGKVTLTGSSCQTNPPVIYLTGPNTGWILGTGSSVAFGRLEPQTATSIASTNKCFFGTFVANHLNVETDTGTVTLTTGGATGTGDSTSVALPLQMDQLNKTFTISSDGTFYTSDHPGVITGIVITGSEVVVVNNETDTYPTLLVVASAP